MGGLARTMPFSLFCFVIGGAALAALPLTSGFYSKDAILLEGYALTGASPARRRRTSRRILMRLVACVL